MSASVAPGASGPLAAGTSVWEVFDAWLRRASALIADSTEALNALNVFPISDADTGSNLRLTLSGIARAVPDVNRASLGAVVQAAILSAHGNSGAIVAEMFSSVCRSLEHDVAAVSAPPGVRVALLLRSVADAARRAVAQPVTGTILTVADDAAGAALRAAEAHPDDPLAVAQAAQAEAHAALQRTPDQLEVLAAGGVVDAGGQAYTLLLDALVEVLGGAPAQPLAPTVPMPRAAAVPTGQEYEVMYALQGADTDALAALRARLADLGDSVVVVGDGRPEGGLAQVHVHLTEPGAAVEAALELGRLSQIRITALGSVAAATRAVLAVVTGPGLADAVRSSGGVPIGGDRQLMTELEDAVRRLEGDVLVLPNDPGTLAAAGPLLQQLRSEHRHGRARRLVVLPTLAQVQGLAALAVHDPEADLDAAVATMSAAAGHARHGAVRPTRSAGPGELVGVVDGEVVEHGHRVAEVAGRVADRLLAAGGELLTVVLGADAPPGLAGELTERCRQRHPLVEVQVLEGGQRDELVLLGSE
ncbi:MAG: DAK2 domain-containing protein [Friedmanniella sp.]